MSGAELTAARNGSVEQTAGRVRSDSGSVLVVYAWNGRDKPLGLVHTDEHPTFDVLVFDYSGTSRETSAAGWPVLSCQTQCKGEIYREVHSHLKALPERYAYVGLIDDDIELTWSGLNRLLAIAFKYRLDSFQAALTPDSHHSHPWLVSRAGQQIRELPWVEVMMPFYRIELFMAGGPYFARSISSYGLDQFVFPALQTLLGMERVAVVDDVAFTHARPITSDGKVFANGLTAHEERVVQWRLARAAIARERPELVGTRWYMRTFSPLNGHYRFWTIRLAAPWRWLHRLLA